MRERELGVSFPDSIGKTSQIFVSHKRNVCFDNNVITKNMNFVFWVKMFLSKHKFSGFCQNVFVNTYLSINDVLSL